MDFNKIIGKKHAFYSFFGVSGFHFTFVLFLPFPTTCPSLFDGVAVQDRLGQFFPAIHQFQREEGGIFL